MAASTATAVAAGVGAAAAVGGTISSAIGGSSTASDAASAQKSASESASQTSLQMYEQARSDLTPWRTAGTQALGLYEQLLGLQDTTSGTTSYKNANNYTQVGTSSDGQAVYVLNGTLYTADGNTVSDPSSVTWASGYGQYTTTGTGTSGTSTKSATDTLRKTPGYQWQLEQGTGALEKSAAARGKLFSGGQQEALLKYSQGLADTTYNTYLNNLYNLVGSGQNAAAQTGALGSQTAKNVGEYSMYGGDATASGLYSAYNASQSAYGDLAKTGGYLSRLYNNLYGSGSGSGYGSGATGQYSSADEFLYSGYY